MFIYAETLLIANTNLAYMTLVLGPTNAISLALGSYARAMWTEKYPDRILTAEYDI